MVWGQQYFPYTMRSLKMSFLIGFGARGKEKGKGSYGKTRI